MPFPWHFRSNAHLQSQRESLHSHRLPFNQRRQSFKQQHLFSFSRPLSILHLQNLQYLFRLESQAFRRMLSRAVKHSLTCHFSVTTVSPPPPPPGLSEEVPCLLEVLLEYGSLDVNVSMDTTILQLRQMICDALDLDLAATELVCSDRVDCNMSPRHQLLMARETTRRRSDHEILSTLLSGPRPSIALWKREKDNSGAWRSSFNDAHNLAAWMASKCRLNDKISQRSQEGQHSGDNDILQQNLKRAVRKSAELTTRRAPASIVEPVRSDSRKPQSRDGQCAGVPKIIIGLACSKGDPQVRRPGKRSDSISQSQFGPDRLLDWGSDSRTQAFSRFQYDSKETGTAQRARDSTSSLERDQFASYSRAFYPRALKGLSNRPEQHKARSWSKKLVSV